MSEQINPTRRQSLNPEQLGQLAASEYARSTQDPNYGLRGRWEVYAYATEQINYYAAAFHALDPSPDDTLLDIGCSDGINLFGMRLSGHKGIMMGIDISPDIFRYGMAINSKLNTPVLRPISFIAANAEHIPLADDSIDGATALFMLYHTPSPRNVLNEIKRILRPDGKAVVATSSPQNKRVHRELEIHIAEELGIEAPPIFTEPFDTVAADDMLPQYFTITDAISQSCEIRIPAPNGTEASLQGLHAYLSSMNSMQRHFRPVPGKEKWLKAMRRVVLPVLREAFQEKGYFTDYAERRLYVCAHRED